MPELRAYPVFISHAWKHNDEYYRLAKMLDEAPNFKWRNCSVPEHDPLQGDLEEGLRKQIRPASVVLILAGIYATHSDWIQFEIDFASGLDKSIVGLKPWGSDRIPANVDAAAAEMVGWNTSTIVDAIRRHAR
jgi:hypothetical protein